MELKLIPAQKTDPGSWPLQAEDGSSQLFFSQSWRVEELKKNLIEISVTRFLDSLFLILAAGGTLSLFLHFVSPAGDFWLNIFWFSLLLDLIFWTRILSHEHKADQDKDIDVKNYFSEGAKETIIRALLIRGQKTAEPNYLFLELLKSTEIKNIFYRLGIGFRQLAQSLANMSSDISTGSAAVSEDFAKIPFLAEQVRNELKISHITPGVLLVALSRLRPEAKTSQLLAEFAVTPEQIFEVVRWQKTLQKINQWRSRQKSLAFFKPRGEINRSLTSLPTPVLDKFSTDLTLRAKLGRLSVVVGREPELNKITSALSGNNQAVLLVGENGTGKTSLIELLAQAMLTEDVPERLFDKRLVRLELAQVVGEGENAGHALTSAINDAIKAGDIVLVAEDIHYWAKAQASGVTLLSILTSALAEKSLPILGTTTPQYFQQTTILQTASVFERIDITDYSRPDVILIASIHASLLESKYKIFWTMPAIEKAVDLSSLYIKGGRQPQKAVKVLEAVAERNQNVNETAVIGEDEVDRVVSQMTHVDVTEASQSEADKLLRLEELLHKKIIGQNEAITKLAAALRRSKAHLGGGHNRPIGSFLFVGPTGVGKTALARALAEIEFGSEEALIRLDLSEYNLPESVEKLLGGQTFTSTFFSMLREHPFSVVLLDEFEKSHIDVQNLFLQVMDAGHLTDNAGNKQDFTNTLIVATSNAASEEIQESLARGVDHQDLDNNLTHHILPKYFRPELLNRFDDIILFNPLTLSQVADIIKLQLGPLALDLKQQGIEFGYSDKAILKIAAQAYDKTFGARPLQRYLQDNIVSKAAAWILSKDLTRRDKLVIDENGQPKIEKAAAI